MSDHSCCVALIGASILAIGTVIAYFNSKFSLVRKNKKKNS